MPVTAARLADVGAGDPHPFELGWLGQHPLQQLAVASLELCPGAESAARGGHARGEGVAHHLQLAEADQPRLTSDGGDPSVDLEPGKGLRDEVGELPLEATDLAPQLGPSKLFVVPHIGPENRVSL